MGRSDHQVIAKNPRTAKQTFLGRNIFHVDNPSRQHPIMMNPVSRAVKYAMTEWERKRNPNTNPIRPYNRDRSKERFTV